MKEKPIEPSDAKAAGGELVSSAYRRYLDMARFGPLDGLRSLAVILVLRNHVPVKGAVGDWIDGSRGVSIFFVLSGYLITTLALREERRRAAVDLRAFYWRRSMRIFPAYYAVLALHCVIVFGNIMGQGIRREAFQAVFPYYATYMSEYAPQSGAVFSQSWTLGIEEKFYLVWPFVAFLALRSRPLVRLGAAVIVATIAFAYRGDGLPFHYACILCGCALGMILDLPKGFAALRWLAHPAIHHMILVAFVGFQIVPSAFDLRRTALYPLSVVLVMATLLLRESMWTRVLSSRPAVFVAERSYGVYLLHVLAANVVERVLAPTTVARSLLVYAGAFVASVAAAHVLNLVIEKPCIAYGRRRAAGLPADTSVASG